MNSTIRCLYGIPTNDLIVDLIQWLAEDESRELLILEEIAERSLPSLLNDLRVCLIRLEAPIEETLQDLAKEFVFSIFDYFPEPANPEKSKEQMQEIFSLLGKIHTDIQLRASDYWDMGINILRNITKNAAHFQKSFDGRELFGAFAQTPAIICGAGPSLEKSAQTLQKLKDSALIFSGGSALSALSASHIVPHFSASIDPNVSLKRFLTHSSFEVPFFYQSRLQYEWLGAMHGSLLWMPPSGNYSLELWLQEERGCRPAIFDGGWNVVTFLTAIAYELGCNPIIFVGCDLSYSGITPYAKGVGAFSIDDVIELEDENGHLVYSRRDWAIAANWLGNFIHERPDRTWMNATEGGLAISGAPRVHLEKMQWKQQDLSGAVHQTMQSLIPLKEDMKELLQTIKESLERADEICSDLIGIIDRQEIQRAEYLFLQLKLEEQPSYQQFLLPIWNVWKYAFAKQVPIQLSRSVAEDLNKWLFIKRLCHDAREI